MLGTVESPKLLQELFSNFSCMLLNPNIFSNLNSNCSNLLFCRVLGDYSGAFGALINKQCFACAYVRTHVPAGSPRPRR